MAYDMDLADRVLQVIEAEPGFDERRMFGSLVFLINGNMACGVSGERLIVRAGPERAEEAMARPGTSVFDVTGKPMKGWVVVDPVVLDEDADLEEWVRLGIDFAESLPPK
jgi:TfoX/Sxy family transcriptional regulator of competence genes